MLVRAEGTAGCGVDMWGEGGGGAVNPAGGLAGVDGVGGGCALRWGHACERVRLRTDFFAAWPLETLVKTVLIWTTSSMSVSTLFRHPITLLR